MKKILRIPTTNCFTKNEWHENALLERTRSKSYYVFELPIVYKDWNIIKWEINYKYIFVEIEK